MTQDEIKSLFDYITAANDENRIVELSDRVDWTSRPDIIGIPYPDPDKPIYTTIIIKIRNNP